MTRPTDAIAGLSERLRKTLGCVEPDDFRGDNLAIFIASELEPSIDDETLDDSGSWKQGALDACDRVLDAIHAHYAAQLDSLLKEREDQSTQLTSLRADNDKMHDLVDQLTQVHHDAEAKCDALQARVKELEASIQWTNEVYPLRICGGGAGVELTWREFNAMRVAAGFRSLDRLGDEEGRAGHNLKLRVKAQEAESRALRAEQERDEAYDLAAKVAENFEHADTWPGCDRSHELSNVAYVIGGETCDDIAAAIRRLSAGPEKEKRE